MVNLRGVQPGGHSASPVALSERIIKQTLLTLDYPQRECGLVHTGNLPFLHGIMRVNKPFIDVKPDNTLISVKYTDVAITQLPEESPSIVTILDNYLLIIASPSHLSPFLILALNQTRAILIPV
jgi:serine/threonine-protein kinase SRPK3